MAESLCDYCSNALRRKWETWDKSDSIYSRTECSIFSSRNVTHITVIDCNKFDGQKMTLEQFKSKYSEEKK